MLYARARETILPLVPDWLYAAQLVQRRRRLWSAAGVIFIHIPKNAGTSINHALYGRFMGHLTLDEICTWAPGTARRLPKVAVVRNPWDRALSAYRFALNARERRTGDGPAIASRPEYLGPDFDSFERFVTSWLDGRSVAREDPVFRPQSMFVTSRRPERRVDFVARMDKLSELEAYLTERLGREVSFGHSNRTGTPGDYRSAYSPETREIVARVYAEDIEAFGYSF